jgi:hypothetical protein
MSREVFTVAGKNLTVVANATLVFINPATNSGLEILRAWISQNGTSTTQQLGCQLSTQVTAFPTLVSATPSGHEGQTAIIVGGTAGAAGTSGVNASAEGAGAKTVIVPDNFNNLNGWLYVPVPEERILVPAGASYGLGLVLIGTPTTLTGWSFGITYRQI